jgi:hypothetical protein
VGKKYISIKDREKNFKRKRNQLKNKIRTDESLSPDEKRSLKRDFLEWEKVPSEQFLEGCQGWEKRNRYERNHFDEQYYSVTTG